MLKNIGLYFRKIDFLNFAVGAIMPIIVLFIVYSSVKSYGIFANEMFYTTKSIWMPTGFHWLWNYTITSLFLVTGTQSFIYVHIIAAMIIMIPLFYIVIGKTRVE